jgi:hypothetical protein
MSDSIEERVRDLPVQSRKLLCVILQQASHGSLRSKESGMATMPEVHEACGLDVDGMYAALGVLRDAGMIQLAGDYPFEEIRLTGARGIALEDIVVRDG